MNARPGLKTYAVLSSTLFILTATTVAVGKPVPMKPAHTTTIAPAKPALTGPKVSPDPAAPGNFEVATGEYKFPATIDPDILANTNTELWARAFWPKDLSKPHPILFFLHGNHSTCGSGVNPRVDNDCTYT